MFSNPHHCLEFHSVGPLSSHQCLIGMVDLKKKTESSIYHILRCDCKQSAVRHAGKPTDEGIFGLWGIYTTHSFRK